MGPKALEFLQGGVNVQEVSEQERFAMLKWRKEDW